MKLFGMILIVLSGTLMGFSARYQMCKLLHQMELFYDAIRFIQEEIRYHHTPMQEIFEKIIHFNQYADLFLFQVMVDAMRDAGGFFGAELVEDAVQRNTHPLMNHSEREVLIQFFLALGESDMQGQTELCSSTLERFAAHYQKRKQQSEKKGRLYIALGVLGGLFCAIMLG